MAYSTAAQAPSRPRPAGARPLPALPIPLRRPSSSSSSSYDYDSHRPVPPGFSLRPPPLPTPRSLSTGAVPPPPRPNLSLSVSPPSNYNLVNASSTAITSTSSSGSGSSSSSDSLYTSSSKPSDQRPSSSSASSSIRQTPVISLQIPSSFGSPGDGFAPASSNKTLGVGIPNGGLLVRQARPKPSIPRLKLGTLTTSSSYSSLRNNHPHASRHGYNNGDDLNRRRNSSDAGSTNSSGSDLEEDDDVGYYGRRPTPLAIPGAGNTDAMPTLRPDQNTMRPMMQGAGGHHHAHGSSYRAPTSMDDVRRAIEESNNPYASSLPSLAPLTISTTFDITRPAPSSTSNGTAASSSSSTTPSPPTRTWTGDESNLEILSRLGEGASGAVFKVRDRRTGVIMAQKTVPATSATNPKALLHEYKSLSESRHENITTFFGAFVGNGAGTRFSNNEEAGAAEGQVRGGSEICLLMEFGEGGSLDSVARRIRQMGFGRPSEKVMGKIAPGILQGLNYLHSNRVIHRGTSVFPVLSTPIPFSPSLFELF